MRTKLPFKGPKDIERVALGDFRRNHIALARRELRFVSRGDPAWDRSNRQIFTDNRFGKPLEQIKIFGKVEWAAEGMRDAIEFLWLDLQRRAKKGRGIGLDEDYLASLVMWDADRGTVLTSLSQVRDGVTEMHFYPNVPYARKVEQGQSARAKRGVVKPAYRKVKGKFGRSVRLFFDWTVPRGSPKVSRTNGRTARQDGIPVPRIRMIQGGAFQ
ncbi:MAG: hypothetical protein AAGC81_02375 [Pseudomonadota bacterium]